MSQDNLVKLKSSASGHVVWTRKNKKKFSNVKLALKKYDPNVRKRVIYKESKK
ncbi:50S ribosomal protein L33 [Candidatus Kaiserbacteria bacterium RIFCSPHIGHO2_01_FULL_48_10]|uniref:Large ribosomal subunit protein bL33 n=1 Tax=Candidatus Kaiserbacteria bacterium RIFCSPHIGHO2_01_FULL_48_10 TaxID=1798476 RepID=A0A1F6C6C0_9BACT|nr:MAG: 50S ribosomal protein L33 [Candidatus Kaiserbacteria bacterium RIFCSPHIGHO2_01_FULL_48_10]